MDKEKIDLFNPGTVMGFTIAFAGDIALFLGFLASAVPIIGLVVLIFSLLGHWFAGLVIGFLMYGRTEGWLAKAVLILSIILPLPILLIGIGLAIFLSNRTIAFLAEQALIVGVGAVTGGMGAVAGEAAVAARVAGTGARAAAAGAEGAQAARAGAAAEDAAKVGRAGAPRPAAGTPPEGAGGEIPQSPSEPQASEEVFGVKKEPWEKVKEIMEQLPESEEEEEEPVDENPLMPEKRDEEGRG